MIRWIVIFLLLPFFSNAQNKTSELGLFLGGSYYMGDLNPSQPFLLTKPAGGVIFRYIINQRYALKIGGLYGNVAGDDVNANNRWQKERNLRFRSPILEASGQIEFNFFPYETGDEKKRFTPYVFIGLGMFHFSPKAKFRDDWYNLQQLGTEGQGSLAYQTKKYSLAQLSIPFGMGIKYSLNKRWALGAEWGMRKTYTDYIDDVSTVYADPYILLAEQGPAAAYLSDQSHGNELQELANTGRQRGNSKTKDWYSFFGATLTYKLPGKYIKCSAY